MPKPRSVRLQKEGWNQNRQASRAVCGDNFLYSRKKGRPSSNPQRYSSSFIQKSAGNHMQFIIQVFQLSSPIHTLRLWVSDLKRSGSLIEEAGVTASTGLFFYAQK
jgi:hypothetical protein